MADFTRSVELIFGGKDNVTPTIKNITKSLDSFDSRVSSLAQPVGEFANSILKVDAALVAVGAAMFAFSTGEAIRFESAQLDLQKLLSDSEGDVDQYTGTIRDLSLQYGELTTNTTASVAEFKQASFSISDALLLVEQSLIAVKISELDSAEASELLKRTIIGFNLEAKDAAGILDTWNESSNNFNTNTREIATGLAELAPIAELVGFNLDQTASLLIPIIERFGSGTEASKALRTALLAMVSPSTTDALDALGISQRNANGEIKNAGDILLEVQQRYQTLSPEQQLYNTGLLVGKNQAARLTPVLTDLNGTLEVQAVLSKKAGSAQKELDIRMQATEEAVKRLKVAFNDAQRAIGDNFLEGVKGSSDALAKLFISIADVVDSGGLAPLFNLMQPLFAEFNADIAAIAKNLPEAFAGVDFSGLVSAFENLGGDLGKILTALFGDFDIETVEGLETVLQTTVDGLTALINVTRGIFQELQPIFESIGIVIQSSGKIGEDTEIAFGRFLGAGKLINDFGLTLGAAFLVINNSSAQIENAFNVVLGSASFFINSIQITFNLLTLTIVETLRQLAEIASFFTLGNVSDEFSEIADILKLQGDDLQASLTKNATEARAGLSQIGNGLSGTAAQIGTDTDTINKSVKTVEVFAKDAATGLDLIGGTLGKVWLNATTAIDPLTFEITQLADSTTAAGDSAKDAGDKTNNWIKSVKSVVDGVITYTGAAGSIVKSNKDIAESADEATEESDKFLIEMEKIASNERIKNIEATIELNVAALEADAKVAVAIIEGLSASIASTAELIGGLFGILQDADPYQEGAILRQIKLENENRAKELALQATLVESQVRNLDAKTDKLRDGDGLITITADGLEPELQAFMMAVLRRVQVQAAEDQSLYLLGLPVA